MDPIEEENSTELSQIWQETENEDTLGNDDGDKRDSEMKPQIEEKSEKENAAVEVVTVELDVERHVVKTNETEPMDAPKPLDKDTASNRKKETSSKKKIESNKKAVSKKSNSLKKNTASKAKDKTIEIEGRNRAANENGDGSVEIVIADSVVDDQNQELKSPMVDYENEVDSNVAVPVQEAESKAIEANESEGVSLPVPLEKDASISL